MCRIKIFVLFFFAVSGLIAQNPQADNINIHKLYKSWKLTGRRFPDSTVTFAAVKNEDKKGVYYAYTFKKTGELVYNENWPGNTRKCGVGASYYESGCKWKVKDNNIINVFITGGGLEQDGSFCYDLDYRITLLSDDKMELKLVKVYRMESAY